MWPEPYSLSLGPEARSASWVALRSAQEVGSVESDHYREDLLDGEPLGQQLKLGKDLRIATGGVLRQAGDLANEILRLITI